MDIWAPTAVGSIRNSILTHYSTIISTQTPNGITGTRHMAAIFIYVSDKNMFIV